MAKFVNIDPRNPQLELEDEHYLLLNHYIRGFTIGTRKRGKRNTKGTNDIHCFPNNILLSMASH